MTTELLRLVGRGIDGSRAAMHSVRPGVIRYRSPLVSAVSTPWYIVEIAGEGGRAYRLAGLTGSAYCQVDHTVWVLLPDGDPHQGASVIGRQLPGMPQIHDIGPSASAIPFLGHPQIYRVRATVTVTDPTEHRWHEPHFRLVMRARITVAGGGSVTIVWHDAPLHLAGEERDPVTAAGDPDATALSTSEDGSHQHTIADSGRTGRSNRHTHSLNISGQTRDPKSPHTHAIPVQGGKKIPHAHNPETVMVPQGYDGPFSSTARLEGVIAVDDWRELPVPDYGPSSFPDADLVPSDPVVTIQLLGEATSPEGTQAEPVIGTADIIEIGVFTG